MTKFRANNILSFRINFECFGGFKTEMTFGHEEYIEILSIDRHIDAVERLTGHKVLKAIVTIDTDRFEPAE